ncbi:hypothetical protein ROHU_014971 [Labeo rohita]|uniref:F-box domain-containing protein n=1 Tax=Labeo rohita TaxID=84645 RepID=A0A498NRC7_LABRO|nr:hypothetical protein ROHU_014971 [Labeo rohita]
MKIVQLHIYLLMWSQATESLTNIGVTIGADVNISCNFNITEINCEARKFSNGTKIYISGKSSDVQAKEVQSGAFNLRNKDLHKDHVKTAQEKGTSYCGVKRECVFTKHLSYFNVLSAYPPDVLHDIFEGVVPIELAQCLALLISKKYFTLESLSESILQFPYKWENQKNKPHAIPVTFSRRNTIEGNAHENWSMIRFLPFLIGNVVPEGEPTWQVLMDLKDIVELVVSPVHTNESISYLERKISEHRQRILSWESVIRYEGANIEDSPADVGVVLEVKRKNFVKGIFVDFSKIMH